MPHAAHKEFMTITPPVNLVGTERRLATIERIDSIRDIPDADAIVCARIRGWDVVVKREDFTAGDTCIYFEVDSFLPATDSRFEFLAPRGVRADENGNIGYVLKTAKLRGQYSQGLALPFGDFPELNNTLIGDDVTTPLGVTKWDPPLPSELDGVARGVFPTWISKTSEQRVQNFAALLGQPGDWIATEKIDGTSLTAWVSGTEEGVAQRTIDLLDNGNKFWTTARKYDLHTILRTLGSNAVVQGEMFGAGVISKNPLGINDVQFRAFTLYIDGTEIPRADWPQALLDIAVPIHDLTFPATVEEAIEQVDGIRSLIGKDRAAEGIVWRDRTAATIELNGQILRASAKVISNKYLLKNDR
jgi:RNA ligase (TIGR02306 family)